MLLGVGKDAELRHLMTSASRNLTEHEFSFDWLGDYAFIGVADRGELAEAARYQRDIFPQPLDDENGRDRSLAAAAHAPAYAGIAIRSTVAKVVERLGGLRSEVSFDDEPNGGPPGTGTALQSLRGHLTLSLR